MGRHQRQMCAVRVEIQFSCTTRQFRLCCGYLRPLLCHRKLLGSKVRQKSQECIPLCFSELLVLDLLFFQNVWMHHCYVFPYLFFNYSFYSLCQATTALSSSLWLPRSFSARSSWVYSSCPARLASTASAGSLLSTSTLAARDNRAETAHRKAMSASQPLVSSSI